MKFMLLLTVDELLPPALVAVTMQMMESPSTAPKGTKVEFVAPGTGKAWMSHRYEKNVGEGFRYLRERNSPS